MSTPSPSAVSGPPSLVDRPQLHRVPQRDVPYVPTDPQVVDAMMRFAEVGPDDVVYDLGCGDGRLLVAAARRGARAVGVDIDPERVKDSYWHAQAAHMGHKITLIKGSFFDVDLRDATVVTMFLLSRINVKLRPKLLWELRPGARIVCNMFEMGDWRADADVVAHHRHLYKWIVPAWVQGRWDGVIDEPGRRRHIKLDLHRYYQHVSGTARIGRADVPILAGRLWGNHFSFGLPERGPLHPPTRYICDYDGHSLRGHCYPHGTEADPIPWGALRNTAKDWLLQ